jgi:hypothetical protein
MKHCNDINNWTLVNPEPSVNSTTDRVNNRPGDLTGKTVVLYWNGKPNGDVLLNRIGELIKEKESSIKILKAWEEIPSSVHTEPTHESSRSVAQKLAGLNPDIVIGAPGDCAGSMMWLVMDQLNIERLGIPAVTLITSPFMETACTIPLSEGFSDGCFVEIPPPIGMLQASAVRKKAEEAIDDLMRALTQWSPSTVHTSDKKAYPADVIEFTGSMYDLNNHFMRKKWSVGLPVIPPTPELVANMLSGTRRRPEEIVGRVPPRMGVLTVQLVAVYAAMAGCRPEYMPVLISAIEGFLTPEANLRLALSGTGTSQLVVIVSGPVVEELGVACGQGAAGKGNHANGSIGYAINLIAYSMGGSQPPAMDRSTLGSPADYVCWVFGENEKALPASWKTFSEEIGFQRSDSVVTVMASYPPIENMDHWSASCEEHVRWWGSIVSPLHNMGGPTVPLIIKQNPIIALGPEHANLIASENWSKDDFRKAFWENTRIQFSIWPSACKSESLHEMLGPVTSDSMIPVTINPDQLFIVIAGGEGKQSHYFAPMPGAFPVSKLVAG